MNLLWWCKRIQKLAFWFRCLCMHAHKNSLHFPCCYWSVSFGLILLSLRNMLLWLHLTFKRAAAMLIARCCVWSIPWKRLAVRYAVHSQSRKTFLTLSSDRQTIGDLRFCWSTPNDWFPKPLPNLFGLLTQKSGKNRCGNLCFSLCCIWLIQYYFPIFLFPPKHGLAGRVALPWCRSRTQGLH